MAYRIVALLSCLALWAGQPGPRTDQEVLAALQAWKQARLNRDGAGLQRLLHEEIIYTHADGRIDTKAELLKAATTGKTIVEGIDFSDTTVRVYGTTALVNSVLDLRNNLDGTRTSAHLSVLQVWLKAAGGWQMVASQAIRLNP
jgi:hypothetical protein